MIIRSITYTNLDGQLRQEDFAFQLTEAEFTKKAMTEGGPAYLERLRKLADLTQAELEAGAGKEVMATFDVLLGDAVGKREGDLFIKNDEIRNRFLYSGAYDALFMELITTPDSGATFMRNMFPGNAHAAIDKALAERGVETADVTATQPTPEASPVTNVPDIVRTEFQKGIVTVNAPELQPAAPQLSEAGKDDEPLWFRESRYATPKELMKMGKEEMQFAMMMKSTKAFG